MDQSAKLLLCKHEDLSWNSQKPCKQLHGALQMQIVDPWNTSDSQSRRITEFQVQ